MNVPDLRHVDFDAYRQRAAELRAEAVQRAIDRALAYLWLPPHKPAARLGRAAATHCPA
jgi:hypothetical protein